MRSPYGLDIIEQCTDCQRRFDRLFCDLPPATLGDLDRIKSTSTYPAGASLFVEEQAPRGVLIICSGHVRLTVCSPHGKILVVGIAGPGEALGLGTAVTDTPHDATAETLEPCQITFIKRTDFVRFLELHGDACLRVARHLSVDLHNAHERLRMLVLSRSAEEKLARLLLSWCENGSEGVEGVRLKVAMTHEQIAQLIDISRETVTRLLSSLRARNIIRVQGSTLVVIDKASLARLADS